MELGEPNVNLWLLLLRMKVKVVVWRRNCNDGCPSGQWSFTIHAALIITLLQQLHQSLLTANVHIVALQFHGQRLTVNVM
jgi:hypothetical protein